MPYFKSLINGQSQLGHKAGRQGKAWADRQDILT